MFAQIIQATQRLITEHAPHAQRPTIVLGLSGGPDSVFLLYVLEKLHSTGAITLHVAHLDHGWRQTSADDAAWCAVLCAQHNIPFHSAHARDFEHNLTMNGSREAFARTLRRTFFEQVATSVNADAIALAHHADDQQETFFIRLLRGSSLTGLCAMQPIEGRYIRPLLDITKATILAYLYENNLSYRTDETNAANDYLRNRIRNHVIPALKQCDQRFDKTFANTLAALQQEENFLEEITNKAFVKIFALNEEHPSRLPVASSEHTYQTTQLLGNREQFMLLHSVIQNRIIIAWLIAAKVPFSPSAGFIAEIIRFINNAAGGSHTINTTTRIIKKQQRFWIEPTA
jgi:tRNA(Ile)-lysidine synthetase-like protein